MGFGLDELLDRAYMERDMEWQPMATAPKDGARVHARDVDGNEQVTWFCDGDWVYAGWRETEDRDEYETEEWWEPTEWNATPNSRANLTDTAR